MRSGTLEKAAIAVALASLVARGEAAGQTVTLRGHVSPVVSVRLWEIQTAGRASASSVEGDGLTLRVSFDGTRRVASTAKEGAVATLALRSNADFRLSAQASVQGPIDGREIAFGVGNARPSGAHTVAAVATSSRIEPRFKANPFEAPAGAGPKQFATVADLSSERSLMTGPRISNGGTFESPSNALLVDAYLAVSSRRVSDTGSFSVEVTFSISSP